MIFLLSFFLSICMPLAHSKVIAKGVSEGQSFEVEEIIQGLEIPWGMAFTPSGELWITQRNGRIVRYDFKRKFIRPVYTIQGLYNQGQGGLFDIYIPKDIKFPGFLTYSKLVPGGATTVLANFIIDPKFGGIKMINDIVIASATSNTSRHFGSRIAVDEETNTVYFSIGDRGVRPNGQNLNTHAGSILRVRTDGMIPDGNPFVNQRNKKNKIWSYGHRNPQGLVYDKENKRLWAIEHGPRGGDELNLIKKGQNYGWPEQSYGKEYSSSFAVGKPKVKNMVQPVHYYVPSIAPSGLELYSGKAFPKWKGNLFSGALALTHLNRIVLDGDKFKKEERLLKDLNQRIRNVIEGPDGFLYVSTDSGQILQIRPPAQKKEVDLLEKIRKQGSEVKYE